MSVKFEISDVEIVGTVVDIMSTLCEHNKDKVFLYLSVAVSSFLQDMSEDEEQKTRWLGTIRHLLSLSQAAKLKDKQTYDTTA